MNIIKSIIFIIGPYFFVIAACSVNDDNPVGLHYVEAGSGETVIFVHGAQEDYRLFMPQVEALKNNYHAVTYSRRYNYPNSYHWGEEATFNVYTEADDLESLIDDLDTNSVHLAGHSYGGLIAMEFAGQQPTKVKSLILSEPPVIRLPECDMWHDHAMEELINKGKTAYATGDSTDVMTVLFEFFVGADIQYQIPTQVLDRLFANLTEMIVLFHSDDPFPSVNTDFDMPVMLITAGNTMPMLECTNEALLARIPEAIHIHVPDATHDMWSTHSGQLSQILHDFLSGSL